MEGAGPGAKAEETRAREVEMRAPGEALEGAEGVLRAAVASMGGWAVPVAGWAEEGCLVHRIRRCRADRGWTRRWTSAR